MDIQSIFYVLGIIFFVSFLLLLVGVLVVGFFIYHKVKIIRSQVPTKVVSFLQGKNNEGTKALGIALVGLVISLLRRKFRNR
jgi:hypothetical protein